MQLCSNKYSVTFGLKNNSEVSKKVLKNVEPELKKDINNGLNAFCDITQKRGIKGDVTFMQITRDFSRCPRCAAPTHKAIAFNGAESEFWYECDKCNTFINGNFV